MKKQIILAFIEGAMKVYLEKDHTEEEAFKFSILSAIENYKKQPLFRTEALLLEEQYKTYGTEKMNLL